MILFFGPAGAGKSVQGQILAESHGWRWISIGQLLRGSGDPEILKTISEGKLVNHEKSSQMISDALKKHKDLDHIILDGYPREVDQAKWLVENTPLHEKSIAMVVVLEVPKEELFQRLIARARNDDEPEAIKRRFEVFERDTLPIIRYFESVGVPMVRINGSGSIEEVQNRIENALKDKVS